MVNTLKESKKFYLLQICNLLQTNKIIELKKYLNNWLDEEEKKNYEESIKFKELLRTEIKKIKKQKEIFLQDFPFNTQLEIMEEKLFANNKKSKINIISNMILEFRPGLFLSAILCQKHLILKNLPFVKTVVLERFNELFSNTHNLTLHEDINNTFTKPEKRQLSQLNNNFRVIGTCLEGYATHFSDALLSRFTLISVGKYTKDEEEKLLQIKLTKISGDKKISGDINFLLEFVRKFRSNFNYDFNLVKIITCLDLCQKLEEFTFNKDRHKFNLYYSVYLLSKGLLQRRDEENINILKQIIHLDEFNKIYNNDIDKNNFFEIKENKLFSKITNSYIFSKRIAEFPKGYCLIKKFSELLEVLHLGMSTKIPILLEGIEEQGKNAALEYLNSILGFEIVKFNISKSTKVEDLLFRTIIDNKNGGIEIIQKKSELIEIWEDKNPNPDKIIFVQNINNASPGLIDALTNIFGKEGSTILLPDGSISNKGTVFLIGTFNPINGSSKEKLPSSFINNVFYYFVESFDDNDINSIIDLLFDFHKRKNEANSFKVNFFKQIS